MKLLFRHKLYTYINYTVYAASMYPNPQVRENNVDSFLSEAIQRNRPRLVLLSSRDSPTLLYKLTAFSNQKVADFGFVSTHGDSKVLTRFGAHIGEKVLLVYKELYGPTSVNKVSVVRCSLLDVVS